MKKYELRGGSGRGESLREKKGARISISNIQQNNLQCPGETGGFVGVELARSLEDWPQRAQRTHRGGGKNMNHRGPRRFTEGQSPKNEWPGETAAAAVFTGLLGFPPALSLCSLCSLCEKRDRGTSIFHVRGFDVGRGCIPGGGAPAAQGWPTQNITGAVRSAGGTLRSLRREAYRFTAWMAFSTRSGVNGNSFKRAPVAL